MISPKIENIFTQEQLEVLHKAIPTYKTDIDSNLGRLMIGDIKDSFNEDMKNRVYEIAKMVTDIPLVLDHALYVEYNKKYGVPNLPPHFDADKNDLIINYQLSANTSWNLGLNLDIYTLEDNSALVFNGNTEIHWRTHKDFKDGEYVKMIFMRFCNKEKPSDYSYLPKNQADSIFKEARNLRDNYIS